MNGMAAEQNPREAKCCKAAPPVLLFDGSGNLLRSWGGPGTGYQWPENEHGIFVDDNDFIWLAGNGKKDGQLLKFAMDGKFVLQIGRGGVEANSNDTTHVSRAAGVAVYPKTNELFIADGYGNRRVIVFDADTGAYKRHWGAYGKKPDDTDPGPYNPAAPLPQVFRTVHCAQIANDGLVYVCDRANDRIQVFRKDGTFVKETQIAKNTLGDGVVFGIGRGGDPQAIDGAAAAHSVDHMAEQRSTPDRSQGFAGQPPGTHADLQNRNDGLRAQGGRT